MFWNKRFTILAVIGSGVALAHAAEVWAPGVSLDGGWYDFNKYSEIGTSTGTSAQMKDDGLMCWAVSASNVIAWWQTLNPVKSEYTWSTIPQGSDIHQTFVAVFDNVGGNPSSAFQWWVDGANKMSFVPTRTEFSDEDESSWTGTDGKTHYPGPYYNGGFLTTTQYTSTPFYNLSEHPATIANANIANVTLWTQNKSIVEALASGYALSVEVSTNDSDIGDHAITLWGVEYEEDGNGNIKFTKAYVTDSDDGKTGLVEATVNVKGDAAFLTGIIENSSYRITNVHGMYSLVPEPTTATLSLLALAGLAARRRRSSR